MLAISFAVFFLMNNPRWATPIRTGNSFNSVTLTFEHADNLWLARTLFIVTGLALAILIPSFWCRYLCPMGALFSLFNRVSLLKLKLDKAKCSSCGLCAPACPMGIEPHYQYDNHNCIKCGRCVDSCHMGALSLGFSVKDSE